MAKHVFSTLAADTNYAEWVTQPGVNTLRKSVLVRGGAGVALGGMGRIYTPHGMRTEVSDEDAEFLSNHKMFKEHQERGHVRIENAAKDAEKVAEKMEADKSPDGAKSGGGSAPKTPADVKKDAEEAAKNSGEDPSDIVKVVTNKGK